MLSAKDIKCDTVPTAGSVQFKLLKICTPTHFAARLLAHKTSNSSHWRTLDYEQRYEQLQQQLSSYFATSDNCIMPQLPQLSDVCVRRLGPNGYERVAITHVPQAANTDANAVLRVKHLDLNTVICHAKLSELLVCPPTLQQIAPLALDLRLSGIVPCQGEEIWQRCDNVSIGKLLHVGAVYEAQVDFGLSHAIFVKDLQLPSL
ncbi:maker10, partial [Drosophila busckii]